MQKKTSHNDIPLSWEIHNNGDTIKEISLFRGCVWLSLGKVTSYNSFSSSMTNFLRILKKSIFLRGCKSYHGKIFENNKFEIIVSGCEAILSFEKLHFQKKSLKELIKRGFRHGQVTEIIYSFDARQKLTQLKRLSAHGEEPELKYLFLTEFSKSNRLFVFKNRTGDWLGALMVSENGPAKYHSELLIRKKNAPVGIMEALVFESFNLLKKDKAKKYLSLGEVPFIFHGKRTQNIRAKIIYSLALPLGLFYNYKGLYKFKTKFNPIWEDTYFIGVPKISIADIFLIAVKTNLLKLAVYRLFR